MKRSEEGFLELVGWAILIGVVSFSLNYCSIQNKEIRLKEKELELKYKK